MWQKRDDGVLLNIVVSQGQMLKVREFCEKRDEL